jgi:CelD/BcsL family acetyltransferase involved in cellulose biosynthesis
MKLAIYSSLHDGPWSPEEWNSLVASSETSSIFMTFQWHDAWWGSYGGQRRPFIVAGFEDGQLVGIAPLMIDGRGWRRRLSFMGEGKADYHDVIVSKKHKPSFLSALMALLADRRSEWGEFPLMNVPASSSTLSSLLPLCGEYRLSSMMHQDTVNHALALNGTEAEARTIMNKKDLRRRTNYMKSNGSLRFFTIEDSVMLERYLPQFFDQHVQRWRKTRTKSLFEEGVHRNFYDVLARELLPTGWLFWSVLEFNGAPVAFHFGFDYRGVVTWYKPSFDVNLYRRSPGKVLLRHLISHAIDQEKNELDYTVGDELFKRRFKNVTRKNSNVVLFTSKAASLRYVVSRGIRGMALLAKEPWGRNGRDRRERGSSRTEALRPELKRLQPEL